MSVAVSPGPWVSRSVIPNRWWILTNRWQTAAPRDHWDLISELLSTQRGRRDTNIILASYKPSSCAVYCVVCGPYQMKSPPSTHWSTPHLFCFWFRIKETSWDSDKWPSVCISVTWCHMTQEPDDPNLLLGICDQAQGGTKRFSSASITFGDHSSKWVPGPPPPLLNFNCQK